MGNIDEVKETEEAREARRARELNEYISWFQDEFERDPTAAEFEADGFEFEEYSSYLYRHYDENLSRYDNSDWWMYI